MVGRQRGGGARRCQRALCLATVLATAPRAGSAAAAGTSQHAISLTADADPTVTCQPQSSGNCVCEGKPIGPDTYVAPAWMTPPDTGIYNTSALIGGVLTPLARYRAKAAIVVNVASA